MLPHFWEISVSLALRKTPFFPNSPRSLHFHPFLSVDRWVENGLLADLRNKSAKHVHILRDIILTFHLEQRLSLSWGLANVPQGHSPVTCLFIWLLFWTFFFVFLEWQPGLNKLIYENACLLYQWIKKKKKPHVHQKLSLIVSVLDSIWFYFWPLLFPTSNPLSPPPPPPSHYSSIF